MNDWDFDYSSCDDPLDFFLVWLLKFLRRILGLT